VTYVGTDQLGVYTVAPVADPAAAAAPSGAASAAPSASTAPPVGTSTPGASTSPGASAAPTDRTDPTQANRFAVALFDVDESTIAPGSAAIIEALGSATDEPAPLGSAQPSGATPSGSPAPVGSAAPGAGTVERPTTRDELWVPIVLLVIVVLCAEWALYHRDGLIRIRRSVAGRFRRQPSSGTS
jgi:hypothetical protein